jgi:uncharacterized protein
MRMNLDELEIRVLGSLMEKELATPENYPLSLNALVSACNQKSNRDPVLNLSEGDVTRALEGLSARGLARLTTTGGRVARYRHSVAEKLGLAPAARGVLAELMLRGAQTAAELRGRAERMTELGDIAAVESLLNELRQAGPPLVLLLPRQPGRKEQRYAQLFAGIPELPEEEAEPLEETGGAEANRAPSARERLLRLEGEVGALREDVAALRREVEELIDSFR